MSFAKKVGKYLNKSFRAGGYEGESFDCIGLIYAICKDMGKDIPAKFEKWDTDNYFQLYENNHKEAITVAIRFLDSFAERTSSKVAGDILLLEQPNGTRFLALYTGNEQAITSYIGEGVSVFKIDMQNVVTLTWRIR